MTVTRRGRARPDPDAATLFACTRCHFHRVCGGWVIEDEQVCAGCKAAFGPILRRLPAPAAPMPRPPQPPQERRNQRCWLCEERRTCRRVSGRWECRRCRTIG